MLSTYVRFFFQPIEIRSTVFGKRVARPRPYANCVWREQHIPSGTALCPLFPAHSDLVQ